MPIISIMRDAGSNPSAVRMTTSDTLADVVATDYILSQFDVLNDLNKGAFEWIVGDLVAVVASDGDNIFRFDGSDFNTLIPLPGDGGAVVVLPTVANHIATYTDTAGTLSEDPTTAISAGSIQAGLSGTAGSLTSYPATASSGFLSLSATTNSGGNFSTTITNASSVGQSQTLQIPDVAGTTGKFIMSKSTEFQTIAGDIEISDGFLVIGKADDSGQGNSIISFESQTASKGTLSIEMDDNLGDFHTLITNIPQGQSTRFNIPDIGVTAGYFAVTTAPISSTPVSAIITKDVTLGFAALATAGKVFVQSALALSSFKVRNVIVNTSTGLSGGGGDRDVSLLDGTGAFAVITAALAGTPVNTVWGGTGLSLPTLACSRTSDVGTGFWFAYSGGTTDYTAGSMIVTVTYERIT